MRRLLVPVALVLGMAVLPGTSFAADAEAGKTTFGKKCASCHGKGGEGNPTMAKMLGAEIKDLGSADVQAKSDEELSKAVTEGVGKMKPVKGLTDEEIANVVAYVRSLKK